MRPFYKITALLVVLAMLLSAAAFAAGDVSASADMTGTPDDGKTRIRVIQTTDIHGYLMDTSSGDESTFQYRLAYIAQLVNDARASEDYADVLLIDGGDTYQGAPVSNLLTGAALRAALDAMDYDAVALGNHEFDWGVTAYCADPDGTVPAYELGAFSGDPDIPLLAYDLYDAETGERVDFTKDYVIVEKAGFSVALIGYIPDYSADIMAERIAPYRIDGDLTKLAERVHEINTLEQPDITVVVAHAAPEPVANALDPDEVDLVTGGHVHAGKYGVSDTGVTYIQGGSQGQGYASATLAVAVDGTVTVEEPMYTSITANRALLYDTEENADLLDDTVLAISHTAWEAVSDDMSEVLGYIDTPVDRTSAGDNGATYAGNWFTGLMLRATEPYGAVAAFYNSGGIRSAFGISAGKTTRLITAGDVYAIAPFSNYWYVYELTGAELARQLADGFRNGNYGDQMSGLTFTYEVSGSGRNAQVTIVSITLDDGTEVDVNDDTTLYRVCTSNYSGTLAGGVFAEKEPIYPAAEAPIDNITMIDLLREEARDNEGYISVDTGVRGICLNPEASGEASGEAAEPITFGVLLADLVEAYENPSADDLDCIDADVAALDDEIAEAIAEHWKRVYLDETYQLLLYGKNDPAEMDIPDPKTHAFVILGYELQNGEMTVELKGRCDAAAAASRAFPEAILVCSGGATGRNNPDGHTEAGLMREYLVNTCGIDASRIYIDERALNTAENAINTFDILRHQGIETMTIITSTYHQRRAQVLYNALAAQYQQEYGYSAQIVDNYCYDTEPSGINASMDDRLAVQQLAGILALPQEERDLLPSMLAASGEPS